ncbi:MULTISPECIES: hypothetical protein [unclassified Pedobacter]|uniref:hypothetical protein n=1 Tax=unclassified Pedobacter TaxID=2628915 RepID=UPI00141F56B9|nr:MULTISPECIES: hypothetical protein [unclassified Pedobacter]NII83271.1 ribosome-associated toxin RatA of RatAB toxin-antitoxin module [Pedobacter sp. SG908]NMN37141.1 ribosome-associated toxin RatA of RatAB toxin-antitoxin module [Pedobacter sp. SG918]
MKINLTLICILFLLLKSYGQNSLKQASPSANFSNTYSQNVDLFTGKLDVGVDLVNLKFAGEDLSVKLKYLAGNGVKLNDLPSWVGLGWSLNTPGYVYRTVKGAPDEQQTYTSELTTTSRSINPYDSGNFTKIYEKLLTTTLHSQNKRYINNYSLLNNGDWNSYNRIMSYNPNAAVSASNTTGWIKTQYDYVKQDFSSTNMSSVIDLAPDDFVVQIGELNGVFYKNFNGEWTFVSNNNISCSVEVSIEENYSTEGLITPGVITKIVLTSSNGIEYTFDGDFEFSKVSNAYNFDYPSPANGYYFYDLVPTLWNITKIKNLNTKEEINFSYNSSIFEVSKFNSAFGSSFSIVYENARNTWPTDENDRFYYTANYNVAHRTKIIKAITCSNGYKILFNTSLSNQLLGNTGVSLFDGFSEDRFLYGKSLSYNLYKLNNISVYNDNDLIRKISFGYKEEVTSRLQLKKINFSDGTNTYDSYSFFYNQTQLPLYGSRKTDHWGYYNGLDFFNIYPNGPYSDQVLESFNNYKIQDPILCKAEILESIKNAAGAQTTFEYEPNDYYTQVNDVSRQLEPVVGPSTGGGVRIKSIKITDNGHILSSKNYYYVKENQLSSGVLATPPPQYLYKMPVNSDVNYSFKLSGFTTNITNSSIVTYSRVIEKNNNSLSTISEFTNFDNGFGDQESQNKNFSGNVYNIKNAFVDNSFKRGKVKSVKILSNDQVLPIEETVYKYQHDYGEDSFPDYRAIYMSNTTSNFYYSAISYKRYADLLREVKNIKNEKSGTIVSTKRLKYDTYNNIVEETSENSKTAGITKTTYKYPYDFSSSVYQEMVRRNLITPVVEEITSVDNVQTLLNRVNYDQFDLGGIFPKTIEMQVGSGPPQTKTTFYNYDVVGNILEKQEANSALREVYLWSYSAQSPIAKIVGSDLATVKSVLGGNSAILSFSNAINPEKSTVDSFLSPLKNAIPTAQITSYTHKPLVGMASMTDVKGMTVYYEYDGFNRLAYVRDQHRNIIKSYCYNYAGQMVDCNSLSIPTRPFSIRVITE